MPEFSILHQGGPAAEAARSDGCGAKGVKTWDGLP